MASEYTPIRVVGRGAFAVCHLATRRGDGEQVVVKRFISPLEPGSAAEREAQQVCACVRMRANGGPRAPGCPADWVGVVVGGAFPRI